MVVVVVPPRPPRPPEPPRTVVWVMLPGLVIATLALTSENKDGIDCRGVPVMLNLLRRDRRRAVDDDLRDLRSAVAAAAARLPADGESSTPLNR